MSQNEMVVYMKQQAASMKKMCQKQGLTEAEWVVLYGEKYRKEYELMTMKVFVSGRGWVCACQV